MTGYHQVITSNDASELDFAESLLEVLPVFSKKGVPLLTGEAFASTAKAMAVHSATHNPAFKENMPKYGVRLRLKSIEAPTLVIVGRCDLICPVTCSEEISAGIPNAVGNF
jgi:proline iminopeptidase